MKKSDRNDHRWQNDYKRSKIIKNDDEWQKMTVCKDDEDDEMWWKMMENDKQIISKWSKGQQMIELME